MGRYPPCTGGSHRVRGWGAREDLETVWNHTFRLEWWPRASEAHGQRSELLLPLLILGSSFGRNVIV